MKKYLLGAAIVFFLFSANILFAASVDGTVPGIDATEVVDAIIEAEGVPQQLLDAGENIRILPTSPFYFFKEWGRGLQRLLTGDEVKKSELELSITNAKAIEAKKVQEKKPNDTNAIQKALANYEKAHARLQERLLSLKETSQNPNVEKLIERVAERTVTHHKLFDEIHTKITDEKNKNDLRKIKEELAHTAGVAAQKDDPVKFAAKLEQALSESRGSELKHIRSVEILDDIIQKAPEETRDTLERLRDDFALRAQSDVENFAGKVSPDALKEALERLPGDKARHAVILEETKDKFNQDAVVKILEEVRHKLETTIAQEGDMRQRAEQQIRRAEEMVALLSEKLSGQDNISSRDSAVGALKEAQSKLDRAHAAFQEEKYGEAFGQGAAAESIARTGLHALEEKHPDTANLERHLNELALRIEKYRTILSRRGITQESHPGIFERFHKAEELLKKAKEAHAQKDEESVVSYIRHIRELLQHVTRAMEMQSGSAVQQKPIREQGISPECYELKQREYEQEYMLREGKITEAEFKIKSESLRASFERCVKEMAAPTIHKPTIEAPTIEKPAATQCELLKKTLLELEVRFKNGELTEAEFYTKAESVRRALKERCDEVAPKPAPPPSSVGESQCSEFKHSLVSLEEALKAGKITEADYHVKTATLKAQLARCADTSTIAPPPTEICTEEYAPVCGADGKTYSNKCYAYRAKIEVKHIGKCEAQLPPPSPEVCTAVYAPVCGSNGKTYSNACIAKQSGVVITHEGECTVEGTGNQGMTTPPPPTATPAPETVLELGLVADDYGFYPESTIYVPKDARIILLIAVKDTNVYYGGLDFKSIKFKTEAIKPGATARIEFIADQSFEFSSYWPSSSVLKATGKVVVR